MRITLSLVVLAVALAAGCGTAVTPHSGGGAAAPGTTDTRCPTLQPGELPPQGGTVPDGFATSWVLRCRTEFRDVPGEGEWSFDLTERADVPATELVAALRKPSDPLTNDPCTADLVIPPYFVLVDATGTAVQPSIPTDACGKPRREVMAMVNALPYRKVSEKRRDQVRSTESQNTGCSDDWKDELAIEGGTRGPAPARPVFRGPLASLRVCLYGEITVDSVPVGRLASGRTVTGEAARNLLAALDKAGPAAPCTAKHTRYAVLHLPSGNNDWAVAELDGCRRLMRTDRTLGQLDERTVAAIAG